MARSPAKEEEDDASADSDGRRGHLCFAVGAEVEVRLDGPGFRGAHFEATVAARRRSSGGYEVVYATLLSHRGGPPLRELAAAIHVRPRPPRPPPGRKFKRFDLVEAFHDDGWWPGVVSVVRRGRKQRYAVSFPLFREQVDLPASLIRPQREFVYGSWVDAQEVLRRIPLYLEGSIVEVMCDEEKQGRAWMPATIIKIVGDTIYVVRYGNGRSSTEILHSSFIRPPPVFDRMKFESELEPCAKVEVNRDGIWTRGVVAAVGSSEPRRYGVRIKRPYTADEDNYLLVSSSSLRPYSKWDAPQWWRRNKKNAKKGDYAVCTEERFSSASSTDNKKSYEEFGSPMLSKASRDSDYSSVPNKRASTENVGNQESHLKHCLHLRKDTAKSLLDYSMDMESLPDKHAAGKSEESLAFQTAKVKEHILMANTSSRLISTKGCDKQRHCLPKVLGTKGKNLLSISSSDYISEIDKSSYLDAVTISDDSGCRNVIEISDNSSSIPISKKRRINLAKETLHSSHNVHPYRASRSPLNLLQAHDTHQDLTAEVSRHSEEQPCSRVLSHSVLPRVSHDPSNKNGGQLIPLPSCSIQGLLRMNETKEPIQSDHLHSEIALMMLDDSAAVDENHEMCQDVIEGKSWMDVTCSKGDDTILINSINSNPETVDVSHGDDLPDRKLKPSSSAQQDVNSDLLCMQAPYDSKVLCTKGKDLLSISSPDDISKIDKSSYLDAIIISDDSGCRNLIDISDNSSSLPNRKKRRMNLPDKKLHSSHNLQTYQASRSPLNLPQAHNTHHDLIVEQPCSHVLSHSVLPRVSHDPSNRDGVQLIPLPGCSVQGLLRINETKEPIQSDHLHSDIALMILDGSALADENHEMCQDVIEGKSWMDVTCSKGEDTSLINSINSNPETVDPSHGDDLPDGNLKPSSSTQQDVNADFLCMQAPYGTKREIGSEGTSMYPEKEATSPIEKLEPILSLQDVKADPLFMLASNDDKMEIQCGRIGMSAKEAAVFHHHNYMHTKKIANLSYLEGGASSQNPLSQLQVSISKKSAEPSSFMHPALTVDVSSLRPLPAPSSSTIPHVFSANSLLLMPDYKMEVFEMLPQKNLHFREVWNCPPEFREGKALGLMLSFANMAESIKNMRIQDDPQLYQEKMSNLIDLEENGFEVSALKVRLDDLLRIRNRQIDLKKRKATLDKELLKLDIANAVVEQQLKLLEMCMTRLGDEPAVFREKASLVTQQSANSSSISRLQIELRQVEDSIVSVEADFNNTAASPWC